ncbi:Uma2 family endonuclease [Roseomonas sp. GCM10028921]
MGVDGGVGLLNRHPWVARRAITVAEFHRMGEVGIIAERDRVELIEGELVSMSPIGSQHLGAVNALTRLLVTAVGDRGIVSVQNPVRLDDRTEPEPDVAVLRPRDDEYRTATPTAEDVLLIVEVADTSLDYDRAVKQPLYASHGIPELWIVDLAGRLVEVCREPAGDGYASVRRIGPDGTLEAAFLSGVSLPVGAVLGSATPRSA